MSKVVTFAGMAHGMGALYGFAVAGVSLAGFGGGGEMIAGAAVGLVTYGVLAGFAVWGVTRARKLHTGASDDVAGLISMTSALLLTWGITSWVAGWLCGFLAMASCGPSWLSPLYHWGGLVTSFLGFLLYFSFPAVVRSSEGEGTPGSESAATWVPWTVMGSAFGVWFVAWMIIWALLGGSIDEDAYPSSSSSPYKLPWPNGETSWVIQGNNSNYNHEGREEHSWDFRLQCGTPVVAARGGVVTGRSVDTNDGHGEGTSNNLIEIDHGDGTFGRYLHIQKDSIEASGRVEQGDVIAKVGNVGNSLTGHIHFVVEQGGTSIPVSFSDVDRRNGIPRTFGIYKSGN